MSVLKEAVDSRMRKVRGIEEICDRCLRTERWGGRVILMVVDAAFTSIGLNYFTAVVPRVELFDERFVKTRRMVNLSDLSRADLDELRTVWKNVRSWTMAKEVASHLSAIADDRSALRAWASRAELENLKADPIGRINGVGLVTFQYLRMMGGVDTVMPDKIVKRVVNEILEEAGCTPVFDDMDFIKKAEEIARASGHRPIELCWMTWLIQPEGKMMKLKKYSGIIPRI